MPVSRTYALGVVTTVAACLVAAPAPAHAASLVEHTVYKGEGGQKGVDTTVTFTLKVGNNANRFSRAIVDVHCPQASNKVVFKNIPVDRRGNFLQTLTFPGTSVPRFQLDGTVKTRHKVELEFSTADSSEPCGNYVMEGSAHD